MGIQINGQTDTISATDGSFTISGASGDLVGNLTGNVTGNVTGDVTGNLTGTASTASNLAAGATLTIGAGSTSAPSLAPSGDSNTGIFFPSADTIAFAEGGAEAARIDSSGRLGLGINSPSVRLHVQVAGDEAIRASATGANQGVWSRYIAGSPNDVDLHVGADGAAGGSFGVGGGAVVWNAGNGPLAFGTNNTQRFRVDASGKIVIGDQVDQADNFQILDIGDSGLNSIIVFVQPGGGNSTAQAAVWVRKSNSTNRSINAAGTVNASGNDYAEYMTKAGDFSLAKGDVCGVNAEGKLTNVFADAISFVVKSTDPSYVGGDIWGTEEVVGTKPDTEDADALATWEEGFEAARQKVDRIAFAGQVPVNVTGATAGQYIIPVQASDGSIEGNAKNESDLTLSEYMRAVGKVIAIEDDGRARIIVKVA